MMGRITVPFIQGKKGKTLLTWPEGAYEGATAEGKQALLTRPDPVPFRYSTLPCGRLLLVLHKLIQASAKIILSL